jgi:hypothetical protein
MTALDVLGELFPPAFRRLPGEQRLRLGGLLSADSKWQRQLPNG